MIRFLQNGTFSRAWSGDIVWSWQWTWDMSCDARWRNEWTEFNYSNTWTGVNSVKNVDITESRKKEFLDILNGPSEDE